MCLVTSPSSGSDQASATLTVLPPIKITEYPTHKRLLVGTGSQFQLSVKVSSAGSVGLGWIGNEYGWHLTILTYFRHHINVVSLLGEYRFRS